MVVSDDFYTKNGKFRFLAILAIFRYILAPFERDIIDAGPCGPSHALREVCLHVQARSGGQNGPGAAEIAQKPSFWV